MKFKHLPLFLILFSCGKEQAESISNSVTRSSIPKLESNNIEVQQNVEQKITRWLSEGTAWKWSDLSNDDLFAAIELSQGEFAVGLKLRGETDSLPFPDLTKRREWENLREDLLQSLEDTLTVEMGREARIEDFVLEVDLHLPIISFHSKSPALVAWLMGSEHIRYIEPLNDFVDEAVNRTESGCTPNYDVVQASDYTTTGTSAKISWHWHASQLCVCFSDGKHYSNPARARWSSARRLIQSCWR